MITSDMVSKVYDKINFHGHGPEGIAEGLEQVFREDLGELLAGADDLDKVRTALSRECVIRQVVAESGEDRQTVVGMLDTMGSMADEAVLGLTDGEPTTLRAAVQRYVEDLAQGTEENESLSGAQVAGDLAAILAYPFPGPSVELEIVRQDEDHLEVRVGGMFLFSATQDDHGRSGLKALENAARAVHREVMTRLGSA